MKKKLFSILLSLCMVITMIPSMALANTSGVAVNPTSQLFLVETNKANDAMISGADYTTTNWLREQGSCEKGVPKERGLGILSGSTLNESGNNENTFKILDIGNGSKFTVADSSGNTVNNCLEIENNEGNEAAHKLTFTENAKVGETYTLSYMDSGKTYSIKLKCTLPTIGAYKSEDLGESNLIASREFEYSDLTEVKVNNEVQDYRYVYFAVPNEEDKTVSNIEIRSDDSDGELEYIKQEGNITKGTAEKLAYIKVMVDKDIISEGVTVEVTYSDNSSRPAQFTITGDTKPLYIAGANNNVTINLINNKVNKSTFEDNTYWREDSVDIYYGQDHINYLCYEDGVDVVFLSEADVESINSDGKLTFVKCSMDNCGNSVCADCPGWEVLVKPGVASDATGRITFTAGSETYALRYSITIPPEVCAYVDSAGTSLITGVGNWNDNDNIKYVETQFFHYNDIKTDEDNEGYKTIYFVPSVENGVTVTGIELKRNDGNNNFTTFNSDYIVPDPKCTEATGSNPAYLAVKVKDGFESENFDVLVTYRNDNDNTENSTPHSFGIEGNYSGGGSTGGRGSGSGSASTTNNITNTAENKATETVATTTATVKAETKTDSTGAKTTTATVDSTTASKIVEKAVENKSEEVVVDTSSTAAVTETAAGAKTEVSIPAETISQISEKTEAEVVIKTDAAEVVLDEKTVETVAEQAGSTGDVKLVVETVAQTENKVQVELKLESSNGTISDFKGGNVSVTVKLGKALAAKKLICVYIDDNGTYHKVSGQLNADGTYTFKTTHFSSYAIMAEEDADAIIAEQIANVEKMVGKLSLKARSSKTSKGNIKVKLITDADDIKALEDLGYTVKYKFYRSTKKASSYKAKFETAGKTYTNTTGKSGTRYYYKARVMVYDAQGTLIAKSALKQCKYAARTK